jgi:hypothetical protein
MCGALNVWTYALMPRGINVHTYSVYVHVWSITPYVWTLNRYAKMMLPSVASGRKNPVSGNEWDIDLSVFPAISIGRMISGLCPLLVFLESMFDM